MEEILDGIVALAFIAVVIYVLVLFT